MGERERVLERKWEEEGEGRREKRRERESIIGIFYSKRKNTPAPPTSSPLSSALSLDSFDSPNRIEIDEEEGSDSYDGYEFTDSVKPPKRSTYKYVAISTSSPSAFSPSTSSSLPLSPPSPLSLSSHPSSSLIPPSLSLSSSDQTEVDRPFPKEESTDLSPHIYSDVDQKYFVTPSEDSSKLSRHPLTSLEKSALSIRRRKMRSDALFSFQFWFCALFISVCALRINFYIGTVNEQLYAICHDHVTSTFLTNIFAVMLPVGGIMSIPIVGYILQVHGLLRYFSLSLSLSLIHTYTHFSPRQTIRPNTPSLFLALNYRADNRAMYIIAISAVIFGCLSLLVWMSVYVQLTTFVVGKNYFAIPITSWFIHFFIFIFLWYFFAILCWFFKILIPSLYSHEHK